MKGSVYKAVAPNGGVSWRYQIDAGRDENGTRIRISKSGFRLEREADEALRERMRELRSGCPARPSETLKQFMDRWLPYHAAAKPLAPNTSDRYVSLAAHAIRALGNVPLTDLTTFMLDDLYVKLRETLSGKT